MAKRTKLDMSGEANPLGSNPFSALASESLAQAKAMTSPPPMQPQSAKKAKRGRVNVRLEKSGRGGKWVTVMYDFPPAAVRELSVILKQLQAQLSTGGTVKNQRIELQGDHKDTVFAKLRDLGFQPVQAGA